MRRWRLVVGILITLGCLSLALVGIDWTAVGGVLRQAEWRFFVPAVGMLLAFVTARSVRWRMLLGPQVPLSQAIEVTGIGYLVSNILPFRLGDAARAVAIGLREQVRVSSALSTVVTERVLDLLSVVFLLVVTAPFVSQAGWVGKAGIAAGVAAGAALAVLLVLAMRPEWGYRALGAVLDRVPGISAERWLAVAGGLLDGLAALRSMRTVGGLVAWSVVTWTCSAGCYLALMRAFIPRPTLPQAGFLCAAIGIGMALPSAPGAAGVFHSVARYALQIPFAVPKDTAFAVAFASHAFMYICLSLLGLLGLAHQGISWGLLRSGVASLPSGE
jgi:uncharacterized membrane protein YbhN (UPF0104 family)